jgi:hypothetical protein
MLNVGMYPVSENLGFPIQVDVIDAVVVIEVVRVVEPVGYGIAGPTIAPHNFFSGPFGDFSYMTARGEHLPRRGDLRQPQ